MTFKKKNLKRLSSRVLSNTFLLPFFIFGVAAEAKPPTRVQNHHKHKIVTYSCISPNGGAFGCKAFGPQKKVVYRMGGVQYISNVNSLLYLGKGAYCKKTEPHCRRLRYGGW